MVLSGLTLDQLRGMLKLRHAEVEQQVAQEQGRLARIAARLRQIESEDTMSELRCRAQDRSAHARCLTTSDHPDE